MIDPGKGLGGPSLAENLLIRRADPGRGRRGASGMAHRFFLLHATTEDLLRHDMEKLAAAFPQHTFRLELDGIAGFAVFVNDAPLLQSDSNTMFSASCGTTHDRSIRKTPCLSADSPASFYWAEKTGAGWSAPFQTRISQRLPGGVRG